MECLLQLYHSLESEFYLKGDAVYGIMLTPAVNHSWVTWSLELELVLSLYLYARGKQFIKLSNVVREMILSELLADEKDFKAKVLYRGNVT